MQNHVTVYGANNEAHDVNLGLNSSISVWVDGSMWVIRPTVDGDGAITVSLSKTSTDIAARILPYSDSEIVVQPEKSKLVSLMKAQEERLASEPYVQ